MTHPTTDDLLAFIDASPTPYHCAQEAARRLQSAGFSKLDEKHAWSVKPGEGYFVLRAGALVAFRVGQGAVVEHGFRLLGAHTDSPNLRVKPLGDIVQSGYQQLGVEVYGGALTYTWLDRDLGIAGLVGCRGQDDGHSIDTHLVDLRRPLARIPSLAIHLNRKLHDDGLKLNSQKHLAPVWGLAKASVGTGEANSESGAPGRLRQLLSDELNIPADRILSWDLSLMDLTPATVGGVDDAFIFAPRLDNQGMAHASLLALQRATPSTCTQVVCLYDHEEVGSSSAEGAAGPIVESVLERLAEVEGPGATAGGLARASASSMQVSADMAHAIHPNYADRHEPDHMPQLNGGPVIKINAQQRYATETGGAALFEALCQEADIPVQKFVNRTDLPCGSTIGPISAARLGIQTIDVGNPMLSMHSIREQSGADDPERMTEVMRRFLEV